MTEPILATLQRRSAALVARDGAELRALHHPDFRFTTPRGDVRDLEAYIAGNTAGCRREMVRFSMTAPVETFPPASTAACTDATSPATATTR